MTERSAGLVFCLLLSAPFAAATAGTAYIPLGEANEIAVVDTERHAVVDNIPGVNAAHGLAITPDGQLLIAASLNAVPRAHGALPAKPAGVSAEDHAAHHGGGGGSTGGETVSYLTLIEAKTRRVVRQLEVPGAVHHVQVTPDGRYAVATHLQSGSASIVDLGTRQLKATVPTGPNPNYATPAPDGRTVFVSNSGNGTVSELDVVEAYVRRNLKVGEGPEHMVLSRDGTRLYVNNASGGDVSVVALPEGRVLKTFETGRNPHGMDLSADESTLFVALTGEDRVLAIDLATGSRKDVALGPLPYHLARVPLGGGLYVSSRAEPRVWVIDESDLSRQAEFATRGIAHQTAIAPGGAR